MTTKELYVQSITKRVIRTVKNETVSDVILVIEEVFNVIYRQGFEAGKKQGGNNE